MQAFTKTGGVAWGSVFPLLLSPFAQNDFPKQVL
jgi:hypothetical protein